jgi:C1A family cysteine protease
MATGKALKGGGGTAAQTRIRTVEVLAPGAGRGAVAEVKPLAGRAPPLVLEALDARSVGPQHTFPDRSRRGLGWLRDTPDIRDMTLQRAAPRLAAQGDERELHARASATISEAIGGAALPANVDNRAFCSPVEDQGQLGSCTANACVGLVEYMERRASGRHIEGSRLYVYKTTRKLLGWTGDTGAFLRTTMQALVLFGVPPEEVWPYQISSFDDEPDPYMYAYGANYKAVRYLRLDPAAQAPDDTLAAIKGALSTGYAAMFGFPVYSSMGWGAEIPFPASTDTLDGGHAILAVGYDDDHACAGPCPQGMEKGALLIRNSWSADWGDGGYGWLPYAYVLTGMANDFWTCFTLDWVESGQFG